ncbi:hypothetical protein LZ30DRAFT_616834 [Colletotrichum cereale]|nr:hypothetical protein LZ30DRAFT_616834 [Colletotrichum cereale]
MVSIPSKTISVAQYRSMIEKIANNDYDEIIGWLTKNHTDNLPWVVRVKSEFYQVFMDAFPGYAQFISTSRNRGAVKGTAMISTSRQVHTVGGHSRPPALYRVIHQRQPNDGIKSRLGRGSDPIFLQLHLQKHLQSRCRELSPFLSATTSRETALGLAAKYAVQGIPRVQIIKFETNGPAWNHDIQRLWHATSLLQQFGLSRNKKALLNNEYLAEHSILEKSIIRRYDWNQDKDELDPCGLRMRKAAKDLAAKKRSKENADKRKRAAAEKRKADDLDESEPETKKRKTGKWVKVGIKVGRNTGA